MMRHDKICLRIPEAPGQAGMTLIEVILAAALLGIIATFFAANMSQQSQIHQETRTGQLLISQLDGAIRSYVTTSVRANLRSLDDVSKRCRPQLLAPTKWIYQTIRINQAGTPKTDLLIEPLSEANIANLSQFASPDLPDSHKQILQECRQRNFLWSDNPGPDVSPSSRSMEACLLVRGLQGANFTLDFEKRLGILVRLKLSWFDLLQRDLPVRCDYFYSGFGRSKQVTVSYSGYWGIRASNQRAIFNYKIREFVSNEG